jgi:hypothetical protein
MSYRPRASEIRQKEFAEMAQDFEAGPLHNTVYDEIIDDDQLAQFCDAAAEAKNARHSRESAVGENGIYVEDLNEAWGTIAYIARQRALEVVAEACARVIQDGEQWIEADQWDATKIREAQEEAREWMKWHTNETERANVAGVLTDD